jgi:hypothetical protein
VKVPQLQAAIGSLANLIKASGSSASALELRQVSDLLDKYGKRDADEAIEGLAAEIEALPSDDPSLRRKVYAADLEAAGTNFEIAAAVLKRLESDKSMRKADVEALASDYVGSAGSFKTRAQALAAIEARAFERARSESQQTVLRKVTPW